MQKNTLFQKNPHPDQPTIGLIAIKKVINPYAQIKIKADASSVDTQGMPFVINPFDEAAIIEAIKLKESGFLHTLIVVSIGEDCKDILIEALAKGADQAIFIKVEQIKLLSPLKIAKILKYIVTNKSVNLVFLGKQSSDSEHNQIGPMLAGLLEWPQGCLVSKISCTSTIAVNINAGTDTNINTDIIDTGGISRIISVEREVDNGIETLQIQLPAVITFELSNDNKDSTNLKHLSVKELMQAKKKPFETIPLETILIDCGDLKDFSQNSMATTNTRIATQNSLGVKLSNSIEMANLLNNLLKEIY